MRAAIVRALAALWLAAAPAGRWSTRSAKAAVRGGSMP